MKFVGDAWLVPNVTFQALHAGCLTRTDALQNKIEREWQLAYNVLAAYLEDIKTMEDNSRAMDAMTSSSGDVDAHPSSST